MMIIIISGCNPGTISINGTKKPFIKKVELINDQLIVEGTNLNSVQVVKINGSNPHTFKIDSRSENKLTLSPRSAVKFLVGETLNLIVSNANASSSFPITFELTNLGATSGQVLKYNGSNWSPGTLNSTQIYAGTYDATTDTPDIVALGGPTGTYYIVTVAGTQDVGNGPETFNIGDWIINNGTNWERVPVGNNTVSSFKGRTGVVVPLNNDYTWSMLGKTAGKLTGSKISEIEDVNVTGIQDGHVLKWEQATGKWIVGPDNASTSAPGAVTNSQLANGAVDSSKISDNSIVDADVAPSAGIAMSKILNLVTTLAGKEPTIASGGPLQYYRGDKTWQVLNTTAVAEGTNLYFLDSRVRSALLSGYTMGTATPILATDTLIEALGKLEAQVAANPGHWTKTGSDISYTGGNVGVGTTGTPRAKLDVNGTILAKTAISNATSTIDFGAGNLQYTSSNCGAFSLHNLKDGGTYSFLVQGTSSTTCSFTAYSDAGTTALSLRLPPDHGPTTASKYTLYSFIVFGSTVITAWIPGY